VSDGGRDSVEPPHVTEGDPSWSTANCVSATEGLYYFSPTKANTFARSHMSKHRPFLVLNLAVLAGILIVPVAAAQLSDEDKAQATRLDTLAKQVEAVRTKPGDLASYKPLYEHAKRMRDSKAREPLCFTVALGMLYCGKDAIYQRQRKSLKSLFPRSRYHKAIAPSAFRKVCDDCAGEGKGERECGACKGTGKCTNAKCLDGKITYRDSKGDITKDCPVCQAQQVCPACKGKGRIEQLCLPCGGEGGTPSRTRLKKLLLAMVDESLAAVRSHAADVIMEARLGEVKGTGKTVTPPELKDRLQAFGQWMLMQQRRLDTKIVSKVYAKFEKGDAVLCLVMTPNFIDREYDWRLTIAKSCFKDWRTKCTGSQGKRYYPGMLLLDEAGKTVGEFVAAESRISLPK